MEKKNCNSFVEREKLFQMVVYASFSGLGGVVYDRDAIYIETRGIQAYQEEAKDELHTALSQMRSNLDVKLEHVKMVLLSDSIPIGELIKVSL